MGDYTAKDIRGILQNLRCEKDPEHIRCSVSVRVFEARNYNRKTGELLDIGDSTEAEETNNDLDDKDMWSCSECDGNLVDEEEP